MKTNVFKIGISDGHSNYAELSISILDVFTFSLLLIILVSCNSSRGNLEQIDPPNYIENKLTLSEIADEIFYIPLDNSIPIGYIFKIKKVNNSIYASVQKMGLLVFNSDGTLNRKIGEVGKGPGEYMSYMNFTVDSKKGSIYIMDYNTIKVYSGQGSFVRSLPLKEYGSSFREIEIISPYLFASEYLSLGRAKYNWIILDTLGELTKWKLNYVPEFKNKILGIGGIYSFEDKVHYWDVFNDTIFSVLPDLSYKTPYVFSQGEYRMPRREDDNEQLRLQPVSIFETSDFLVHAYLYNKKKTLALINKKTKKTYLANFDFDNSCDIENDLDGGLMCRPLCSFNDSEGEFLLGYIHPNKLRTHILSNEFKNSKPKYSDKKNELEKLANNLSDTDNPVLMLVRLKK